MDFSLHSYFSILYIVAFLPIVLVAYQVVAQRLRWAVLLVASYAFFWAISSKLIVFILISTVSVYLAGRKMGALFSERDAFIAQDKTRKKELKKLYQKKARLVCGLGVGFNLLLLACLKYLVFFGEVAGSLLALFGLNVPVAVPYIGVPIGISFYTLMAASYLFDVYRGTIAPDTNLGRVALFLSFFPQIMEGPICRYDQTAKQLWAGTPINKDNLYRGSVRILWGFAKKMIVADRLNLVVKPGLDHQVEAVGDDHLLGESPKDAHAAPVEVVLVYGGAGPELLGRLVITADGAFHDLGEEAQEKRDPAQVGVGRDGAAIDVEEVRRRHERVERDADGHADVRHRHGHVQAEERKKRPCHLAEEDQVFEAGK